MDTATKYPEIEALLEQVSDPEIPVLSIMDMGVVRSIEKQGDSLLVKITPTYSGCPAMDTIAMEIKATLEQAGYPTKVKLVLAPAWDYRLDHSKRSCPFRGIRHCRTFGSQC